jgi:hypothetical protein
VGDSLEYFLGAAKILRVRWATTSLADSRFKNDL